MIFGTNNQKIDLRRMTEFVKLFKAKDIKFILQVFRVLCAYFGVKTCRKSNMIWDALYNSFTTFLIDKNGSQI